jgi:hypothetical protein
MDYYERDNNNAPLIVDQLYFVEDKENKKKVTFGMITLNFKNINI